MNADRVINKINIEMNAFNESGGREDKACAEGLRMARTYIQQEVLKRKILTHDQQIVLEWLTENIHLGTLPFNQISLLNQSFFNSPIDTSDKYLKAFGDLDSQEQFQVLAAFASYGLEDNQ